MKNLWDIGAGVFAFLGVLISIFFITSFKEQASGLMLTFLGAAAILLFLCAYLLYIEHQSGKYIGYAFVTVVFASLLVQNIGGASLTPYTIIAYVILLAVGYLLYMTGRAIRAHEGPDEIVQEETGL